MSNEKRKIMSEFIEVTKENLNEVISNSQKIVLLDFYAPWCGPCKALMQMIDELSVEYANRVIFAKINVDEFMEFTGEHRIRTVPYVLLFKNGGVIERIPDLQKKSFYQQRLNALI